MLYKMAMKDNIAETDTNDIYNRMDCSFWHTIGYHYRSRTAIQETGRLTGERERKKKKAYHPMLDLHYSNFLAFEILFS